MDLEDYAHELGMAKAKQVFFKIETKQADIEGMAEVPLEDGTLEKRKVQGGRFTATIQLTALGQCVLEEAKPGVVAATRPDTLLSFSALLAQKDCFSGNDKAEFDQVAEANWKAVINEVKKQWAGAFFEGEAGISD